MPGYLIQSLNFTIDLMIQHKYKNWIEVWRFFFCQNSPSFYQIFLRNLLSVRNLSIRSLLSIRMLLLLCVRFPSEIFFLSDFLQKSSSFCQISFRNLLSVRFPQKSPSFLSDFPQKFSFCQVSFRKLLLSVSFPLEISFFLSEVRNIHLSVRFSSNISFFSVRYFLLSVKFPSEIFCQKSPFCQVSLEKSPDFLELK